MKIDFFKEEIPSSLNILNEQEYEWNQLTLRYLYILYFGKILKEANIENIDENIAHQYLTETLNEQNICPLVISQFYKNHKDVLYKYIADNYFTKILQVLESFNKIILNEKKYTLLPLSPELYKTLVTFFIKCSKVTNPIIFRNDYNIPDIENEMEVLVTVLQGYIHTIDFNSDGEKGWWIKDRKDSIKNPLALDRNLIVDFITRLTQDKYGKHQYFISLNSPTVEINKLLHFWGNVIIFLISLFVPTEKCSCDMKTEDIFWKDLKNNTSFKRITSRYAHLTTLNINNIICGKNNVIYKPSIDYSNKFQMDSLVEKYLYLLHQLNKNDE